MNETENLAPANPSPNGPSPKSATGQWLMFAVACVVIVVATIAWQLPLERDRWALASAVQVRHEGKKEEAYAKVTTIIERNPKNALGYLLRAQWRLDDEEFEKSLADIDQALALHPSDARLRMRRSIVLQHLDRHDEAIADLMEILSRISVDQPQQRAEALNAVAYARAVGNRELPAALKQIEEADKILPDSSAILDTYAYVLFRLEQFTEAEKMMNRAMSFFEPEFKAQEESIAKAPKRTTTNVERDAAARMVRRNAAVMYYHRGAIREKLENKEGAEADFKRVTELGFTPGEDLY